MKQESPGGRPRLRWRRLAIVVGVVVVLAIVALVIPMHYGYRPAPAKVVNNDFYPAPAYSDAAGNLVMGEEAPTRPAGDAAQPGAVKVTAQMLARGERAYYDETFGNEIFLSDVMGILAGGVSAESFAEGIAALHGNGTTNLRVPIARAVTVGGRRFEMGEWVDTGIDVPAGAVAPLGMKMFKEGTRVRAGITCAACHSTVDPVTFKVVHGAANPDLNTGLLIALAPNSAAFFPHTDVGLDRWQAMPTGEVVTGADGKVMTLPDAGALEDAVDRVLLSWPPGGFDSMVDMAAAPTKIPQAFARGNWPYNYSGGFAVGPFHGLSVQTNNVHGLNSDTLTLAGQARELFGMDPEVYLAVLLRRSSSERLRWKAEGAEKPSALVARVMGRGDGLPVINEVVALPTFPKASVLSPTSLWNSKAGTPVWESVNAMAAWQMTLKVPLPTAGARPSVERMQRGQAVLEQAGCTACHSGPWLTNNRVVPTEQVGTQALRARSLKKMAALLADGAAGGIGWRFDEQVPLRPDAGRVRFPVADWGQVELAMAAGDSAGGYKVPSLVAAYWTARYLHDGGVAVGADAKAEGVPVTLLRFVPVDPHNSMMALIDRQVRERVVAANRANPRLAAMHVTGEGHPFWVDGAAGYSADDQEALVDYLFWYRPER